MPLAAYERVRHLIVTGGVDMLSSDVFDTLVWRDVAQPTDLFLRLGQHLRGAGLLPLHVGAPEFRRARVNAERAARRANQRSRGSFECTLGHIWEQMPPAWLDGRPSSIYVEREVDEEAGALHPHPPAVALLDEAISHGIRVALVSDTYFTSAQLRALLLRVGVPDTTLTHVVVSSEAGCSKSTGLLGSVIAESGCDPARVLHIGDHPVADVATATSLGLQICDVGRPRNRVTTINDHAVDGPIAALSAATGSDGGVTALTRHTLVEAGPDGESPSYQFGAAVAGPLLSGFAHWVASTAADLSSAPTYCLLREGAVIADLVRTIRPDHPTRLVHASRWVYSRAAVITGSEDELEQALARRAPLTADHVAAAFGIDTSHVAAVIGSAPIHHEQRPDAIAALAADEHLRGEIIAASARIRRPLAAYLRRVVDVESPIVLTDIGWGGTIQVALERVLRSEGVRTPVVGLYLMLSTTGLDRVAAGHRMLGYIPRDGAHADQRAVAALARNVELIERITTPAQGTLIGISDDGQPITAPADDLPPTLQLAQRGLFDIARRLAPHHDSTIWVNDERFHSALAAEVSNAIQAPSADFARDAGRWPHDDVAGEGVTALIDAAIDLPTRFMNAYDASRADFADVFWPVGRVAADNPLLAAQLAAVASGVEVDAVAPGGPLGDAFIAAFESASPVAVGIHHARPGRVNGSGWSVLSLTATLPNIREIQISMADTACVAEIGAVVIQLEGTDSWRADGLDALGQLAQPFKGRWVAPGLLAAQADGLLIVYPPAAAGAAGGQLRVTVAFRGLPLPPEALRLAAEGRLRTMRRRVIRTLIRRGVIGTTSVPRGPGR